MHIPGNLRRGFHGFAGAVCLSLCIIGCEKPAPVQQGGTGGVVETPTVKILSPSGTEAVAHDNVIVEFGVTGFPSLSYVDVFVDGISLPSMRLTAAPFRHRLELTDGLDSISYKVEVRAYDHAGFSRYAGPVHLHIYRLAAPTDLRLKSVVNGPVFEGADLTWTSKTRLASIEIDQSENGSAYRLVRTLGSEVTSTSLTGPFADGTVYTYRISAVGAGGNRTQYAYCRDTLFSARLVDYFPPLAVGDSIVWDYNGGWVTSGASQEYYQGTKTWRVTGDRTQDGQRVYTVEQTFSGFKYGFPYTIGDTVWYSAYATAGQITMDASHTITIAFDDPNGPASTPTVVFPRYHADIGPVVEYKVGQYVGVRYTLRFTKDRGLTSMSYAVGGGHTSFICVLERR